MTFLIVFRTAFDVGPFIVVFFASVPWKVAAHAEIKNTYYANAATQALLSLEALWKQNKLIKFAWLFLLNHHFKMYWKERK